MYYICVIILNLNKMDSIRAKEIGINISNVPEQYVLVITKEDYKKLLTKSNDFAFYVAEKTEIKRKIENVKIIGKGTFIPYEPSILVHRLILNNGFFLIDKNENTVFEKIIDWDIVFKGMNIENKCLKELDSLYQII